MGAEGRGQLVMHKGRHSGVNFSRFLSQCKVLSFLFEDESSFCGLLEEKKKEKKGTKMKLASLLEDILFLMQLVCISHMFLKFLQQ